MSTLSPFREDGEAAAPALLEWLPPLPVLAPAGGTGSGTWVFLVAGFDYERSGVDFEKIALRRMSLLIERNRAAQKRAKATFAQLIDSAPRFVLFDFKSGIVRRSEVSKPKGERKWTEVARFTPVTPANYSGATRAHLFDTGAAGTMSIIDVYKHVQELGRTEPGSLRELSFLSHGFLFGPILVNSDDGLAGDAARDPNDKDGRLTDFDPPNMDAAAKADFQKAFAPDGFIWVWGCVFANSPRQVLHRVLSSRKYPQAAGGTLDESETFDFTFSRDHAEQFFDVDPAFFPTRTNGRFPLTFRRTLADIKTFLNGRLGATYCQTAALAAQVPCFGGLPGTYSDYERGARHNVMVVPTRKPPYADNFSGYLRFYKKYTHRELDPEGRNYGRYDP